MVFLYLPSHLLFSMVCGLQHKWCLLVYIQQLLQKRNALKRCPGQRHLEARAWHWALGSSGQCLEASVMPSEASVIPLHHRKLVFSVCQSSPNGATHAAVQWHQNKSLFKVREHVFPFLLPYLKFPPFLLHP